MRVKLPLPLPNAILKNHSEKIAELIREEIIASGPISFARYMDLALYAPNMGYYRSGQNKFGSTGDFVTAPEISPLFSRCLGKQCEEILRTLDNGIILEIGAGTGKMALDLLRELRTLKKLPQKYYILEPSAELRDRQRQLIAEEEKEFLTLIEWLNSYPTHAFKGVVIANEVLDAMPVHKFKISKEYGIQEYFVDYEQENFKWRLANPIISELVTSIEALQINFPDQYESEINLKLVPWMAGLSEIIEQGVVILIDYGFCRREYYHPQRNQGTVMCHFQHRAHADPLIYTGIQDITSHVDFTAVAEAAVKHGFEVSGFTHQAAFLLGCGIQQLIEAERNEMEYSRLAQQAKRLMLPSEMGESFKVIALNKNYENSLRGFSIINQLEKL